MKLDSKSVAGLKFDGRRDVIHFDDQLPGFGYRLRQGAGGTLLRSWVAQYRRAGATRRVLLGSADVLSPEAARQAAKKVLAKVALGGDPQADRADRRTKDRVTLRGVVDEYLATKQVRPKTLHEITRYLTDPGYLSSAVSAPDAHLAWQQQREPTDQLARPTLVQWRAHDSQPLPGALN
jgi:Arm DNA-binding domain